MAPRAWRFATNGGRPHTTSISGRYGSRNAPWIAYGSERFKTLYKRRSAVEREFGRLKHEYGLAFLRVRGIERVRLHADLVMLGRLSLALSRARAVSAAA